MSTIDRSPGVCTVCRRAEAGCICVSHVEHARGQNIDDDERERAQAADALVRPTTQRLECHHLEYRVREALHLYYGRDAAGLARLIRSWFQ